jgi:lipopolysaccharide transport system permease protein
VRHAVAAEVCVRAEFALSWAAMTGNGLTTDPLRPADATRAKSPRRIVIRAETGWRMPDLVEVWHYRELFWVLAERDIRVRYKQTTLGVAWAVIQPLFTMAIFTTISRFAAIPTDGERPELFYFCGMLPWLLIASSVANAGNSLVGSQHVISKVYFPRLVIPAASIITALVDFGIAFVVLLLMMLACKRPPPPQIVFLPAFVALAFFTALGFGLWLGALTTQFRDVRHVTPFLMQAWLFCTPVLYPSSAVHGGWKAVLLGMNPASGIVEGVRWCMLGRPAPGTALALSVATTVVVLATSLLYFHHVERTLADSL